MLHGAQERGTSSAVTAEKEAGQAAFFFLNTKAVVCVDLVGAAAEVKDWLGLLILLKQEGLGAWTWLGAFPHPWLRSLGSWCKLFVQHRLRGPPELCAGGGYRCHCPPPSVQDILLGPHKLQQQHYLISCTPCSLAWWREDRGPCQTG